MLPDSFVILVAGAGKWRARPGPFRPPKTTAVPD